MSNPFEKIKNEEYILNVMIVANSVDGRWMWPDELALFTVVQEDCLKLVPDNTHGYESLKEIVTPKWFDKHVKQVVAVAALIEQYIMRLSMMHFSKIRICG